MTQIFRYRRLVAERHEFPNYLNKLGLVGAAVELGVDKSFFASNFIRTWRGSRYYLVDPWKDLEDYTEIQGSYEQRYQTAKRLEAKYKGRIQVLRMRGEQAAKVISNDLDFVHIDANHSYKAVTEDIATWWPKVKNGGILAGHDLFSFTLLGVTNAVIDFALQNNLIIDTVPTTEDSEKRRRYAPSWWVQKPGKNKKLLIVCISLLCTGPVSVAVGCYKYGLPALVTLLVTDALRVQICEANRV